MVSRKRRDSLDEEESEASTEAETNSEPTMKTQLPRSGRSKGFGGFGGFGRFGGCRGGWGNWENLGGHNNANSNNGGFWNQGPGQAHCKIMASFSFSHMMVLRTFLSL